MSATEMLAQRLFSFSHQKATPKNWSVDAENGANVLHAVAVMLAANDPEALTELAAKAITLLNRGPHSQGHIGMVLDGAVHDAGLPGGDIAGAIALGPMRWKERPLRNQFVQMMLNTLVFVLRYAPIDLSPSAKARLRGQHLDTQTMLAENAAETFVYTIVESPWSPYRERFDAVHDGNLIVGKVSRVFLRAIRRRGADPRTAPETAVENLADSLYKSGLVALGFSKNEARNSLSFLDKQAKQSTRKRRV